MIFRVSSQHQRLAFAARYGHKSVLPARNAKCAIQYQNSNHGIRSFFASAQQLEQSAAQLPSFAPKPIVATKPIRENPDLYIQNCLNRNLPLEAKFPSRIASLSNELYDLRSSLNQTRSEQNALGTAIKAAAPRKNEDSDGWEALHTRAKQLKQEVSAAEIVERQLEDEMNHLAAQLPNLTHPDTPIGDARVLAYINEDKLPNDKTTRSSNDNAVAVSEILFTGAAGTSHADIGVELGILDFASASKTSGWGWYFLHGDAVLLEQALIQYALNKARSKGWTLVSPPSIVYSHIAGSCGFKPRDQNNEQQIYHLSQISTPQLSEESLRPELCLAGTAEIPLAGMLSNTSLSQSSFPKKLVGVSRCYRAEAGSHGLATKGLYRVHEFTKVELFSWAAPDQATSDALFNEICDLQREILEGLEIPARVLMMPTDDLGAPAYRKVDIEAFLPSRMGPKYGGWGEVTSVSECTDYQARRLNARCKYPDGKLGFLWSLNGTALAVPRIIAAILENGWDKENHEVVVPHVLQNYMGGLKAIRKQI